MRLLSSARCPPPSRNGKIKVCFDASVTVLFPVSPGYVATGLVVGMVPPDTFAPFFARKCVASVAVEPLPLKMLTSALPVLTKSRFPGVQTQTNGGPPASAPSSPAGPCGPVGPVGPRGPAGPAGPSTFQLTRVSLL